MAEWSEWLAATSAPPEATHGGDAAPRAGHSVKWLLGLLGVLAFTTLASTQGRKSVVPVIEDLIQLDLNGRGYAVSTSLWTKQARPIAAAEWVAQIDGGERGTQVNFSFIDVAAKVIGARLHQELGGHEGPLHLQVRPVNTVADRRVGWEAQVVAVQ